MKTKLFILCIFCCAQFLNAQDKLVFSFDTAGNQTMRDRICIGCSQARAQETDNVVEDSVATELSEDLFQPELVAYPNPVTDILHVSWINQPSKVVKQLALFSGDNRELFRHQFSKVQNEKDLSFSSYAAGLYFLIVQFEDGKTQSFKIIKN